MKLENIGAANETFYYGFSGKKTSCEHIILKLKEKIQKEKLKKALEKTVYCYPNLQRQIVVQGENIFYEKTDAMPVLRLWNGTVYHLGTEETNGLLFYVGYTEDEIILVFHHGLTDGRGLFEIVKTLLYYYHEEQNITFNKLEKIRTLNQVEKCDAWQEDFYEKYGNLSQKPFWLYENKGAFRIPEPYYKENEIVTRRFRISCHMEKLLSLAKKYQSTPVPVLSMIISQAVYDLYDVGNQKIIGYIPVNLRPFFKEDSRNNFTIAISLPYDSRLKGKDIGFQCTVLRGVMDMQIQKENFIYRMGKNVELNRQRNQMKIPAQTKQQVMAQRLAEGSRRKYTYLLTYIGKTDLPEEIGNRLVREDFYLPAYLIPLTICACVHGDMMYLNCTQNFRSDRLVKRIVEILRNYQVPTEYEDCGEITTDSFELKRMKKIEMGQRI